MLKMKMHPKEIINNRVLNKINHNVDYDGISVNVNYSILQRMLIT